MLYNKYEDYMINLTLINTKEIHSNLTKSLESSQGQVYDKIAVFFILIYLCRLSI